MADEAPTWFTSWVENEFRPLAQSVQKIEGRLNRIEAKQQNAAKSSDEPLTNVPLPNGTTTQVEYPYCLAHFMTPALDVQLPAKTPKWSRAKSLKLIHEYDPGYETEESGDEGPSQKRRARCLARHLGFTNTQLEAWS
uniref:Uncharacterized protein n=1 Tax=Paramoeba aestuarina TaxID=180227 RepID=A0A7S4KBI9_9EUKA|mmetsp:Transcript_16976/g.26493  ORF Transcript_16976/g.26493 Transcript_16976/m.26493 type:complete len:138 (+) Transcript_16976:62-475(+)